MRLIRFAAMFALTCGMAAAAAAQDGPAPAEAASSSSMEGARIDVDRLPISLRRIRQDLHAAVEREDRDGLHLQFRVEVFGQTPEIQLFSPEDDLTTGPVPNTAPTHREMVDMMTPQEFRSPPADLNALFRWLLGRGR
jgi:hypothetical protein